MADALRRWLRVRLNDRRPPGPVQAPPPALAFGSEQQLVVDYFRRNFTRDPDRFITAVDPRCQMYSYGFARPDRDPAAAFIYLDSGLKMLHPLAALARARFGGLSNVGRLLDFASGFGRLTRFLVQEMPPAAIVVSDIQAEAVESQRRTFGVDGFESVFDPAQLRCSDAFDVIFVASLFTHLPQARFHAWLTRLIELLTPTGMLVFSVHDEALLLPHRPMPASGIDFNPSVSEIGTLDGSEYGSTHVSAQFVGRALEAAARGRGSHHRIPQGLWHHDLYVYTPDSWAGDTKPGAGILIPQKAVPVRSGTVAAWFLETDRAHRVTRVELLRGRQVLAATDQPNGPTWFEGDARFLPNAWTPPVYAVFAGVTDDVFRQDVVVKIYSSSGDTRMMPLWSPIADSGG
jgi:SAM-dependent methyltransferase